MWLSCVENPPPYGQSVTIKCQNANNGLSCNYVRRRHRSTVAREDYTDYWTMASGVTITKHSSETMRAYEWEADDAQIDDLEVYEDDY